MIRPCLVAALALLISCGGTPIVTDDASADRGETATVTEGNTPPPFGLLTFNAGLAPGVIPYAERRASPIGQALSASNVELVCLQEVWRDEDWRTIRGATEANFPHAIRPAPRADVNLGQCRLDEVARVQTCSDERCPAVSAADLPTCIARKCSGLASTLSAGCIACLTRDPFRVATEILEECKATQEGSPTDGESAGLAYLGSYGLALISKTPLASQDLHPLVSTIAARGIIHAEIEPAGFGKVHVFCTHLTPQLRGVAHPTGRTWRAEQRDQVDALLTYIEAKSDGGPVVLLGDLNTGPKCSAGVHARLEDHYQALAAAGFDNPYFNGLDEPCGAEACTLCYNNPVSGSGSGGLLIDHILIRGLDVEAHASRTLDQSLTLAGVASSIRYSDHYAVSTFLRP